MKNGFFGRLSAANCALLLFLSAGLVQAAGLKVLSSHVPAVVSRLHLQPMGNLSGSTNLHLAIGLPLRNQEALANLLQQIYDPASTNYHHYLTPEQFTERFGPTEQDYQSVIAFAKANGLAVTGTYSNRVLVDVSGTVANVQKTFHVTMKVYRHPTENRTFYTPDVEPSVPSILPVLDISGLNNYAVPRPMLHIMPSSAKPGNGSSGYYGSYIGYDFRHAYVPGVSLTGSGQTVALVEFDGYNNSDIVAYETQAGLPNVPLQNVFLDGFTGTVGDNNSEVCLDIEMAISMAPGLSGVIVYEGTLDNFIPNDVLNRIATDNSAKQISCSWGWTGGPTATTDNIFTNMALQGQSFFTASGDSDAYPPGTVDDPSGYGTPAASPYVTSVGGTTLTMNGNGVSYSSETVWNWDNEYPDYGIDGMGSSGGISTYYTIPSWQQGINMITNHGSTTTRNFPDVAMTADHVYVRYGNGSKGWFGGTSCAAPLWAGFTALVNQQAVNGGNPPVGFINPAIYAIGKGSSHTYTNDFHDITTGDNTWSGSPTLFHAVTNYDLCTGWGTPKGVKLINALAPPVRTGFLTVYVDPPSGSALISSLAQPIYVTVMDGYEVTNATVTAVVTNSLGAVVANLTFLDGGVAPDVYTNDGLYSATLNVPASLAPLTMTVIASATGEIGVTNVVYYNVISPPLNDYFTNATKVPIGGAAYLANNQYATIETNEPYHDGDPNRAASLWWNWTPTNNVNVLIDTMGSKIDNVLAVYTGNVLATNMPQVAATNSDLGMYRPAQVSFNAQAHTTYHIAVASVDSSSLGSLDLHITPGGQPDITAPNVYITSFLSGLMVYSPIITVAGTASDPETNATGVSLVFVTVNRQAPLTATGTTNWTTTIGLQPGINTIQVSAVDGAGNFSSTVTKEINYLVLGPPNDFFVNATPLTDTSGIVSAENTNATREVGEPYIAGNSGGHSLWWSFTPTTNGVLTLDTFLSTFDTLLGLYTGTDIARLTLVAENDDVYDGVPGGFSEITNAVRGGQTYYIAVDGYNGDSGVISMSYLFVPATVYQLTVRDIPSSGTVQLMTTNDLGGIAVAPGESGYFASNSVVDLVAVPDANSQFSAWRNDSNDVISLNNPLTVVVTSATNITANFIAKVFSDGFESGSLTNLPWTANGDVPWIVQTNVVCVGQYAARSGVISNGQSSSLIITTNFYAGTGSFAYKVSSETNWDQLQFYVDGVLKQQWSGEAGWATYTFPLTASTHTLEWRYVKDLIISNGLDAAFIDDVNLPIVIIVPQSGTVDWTNVYQRIDGFGASSAWQHTWTSAQADMFFSTNSGIGLSHNSTNFPFTGVGLSLLRNHIVPANSTSASDTPSTVETNIMQMAQARGAKVWSAPWTPASGFKNNDGPNGGLYLGSGSDATNLAYASQLANYVASMKTNYGVNLYAISVQNEADLDTSYESCVWTGSQIHDFVTNLHNVLVAKGLDSTKIIIPESLHWSSNTNLYTPSLNDTDVAPNVGIIANHNYDGPNSQTGSTTTPAALSTSGKPLWETEVMTTRAFDGSIADGLYWAVRIHLFMTAAQANAWHYWWLISLNDDNEGLTDINWVPAKRMYTLGNFSRFVRPGYYRIGMTNNGSTSLVSAYNDTNSLNFAIVAINTNYNTDVRQTFNLTNFPAAGFVTPWITSSTNSLVSLPTVTVSNSSFTYTIPIQSVVTFVGQATTNVVPAVVPLLLTPVANQTVTPGITLVVTNTAIDQAVPPKTLTWLLGGPTNAALTTLNATNARFMWRPLVSQANTTNVIYVVVADNGTPSLSATNSFKVIVNPLSSLPTMNSISMAGGRMGLVVNGPEGPDYTVLTSTNLADPPSNWQTLFTTNSPVTPLTLLVVTNNAGPVRFYRLQLGP